MDKLLAGCHGHWSCGQPLGGGSYGGGLPASGRYWTDGEGEGGHSVVAHGVDVMRTAGHSSSTVGPRVCRQWIVAVAMDDCVRFVSTGP